MNNYNYFLKEGFNLTRSMETGNYQMVSVCEKSITGGYAGKTTRELKENCFKGLSEFSTKRIYLKSDVITMQNRLKKIPLKYLIKVKNYLEKRSQDIEVVLLE